MGVDCDWLKGGLSVRGVWFVLLAGSASPYVVLCEVLHIFSLISLAEEVYGVRYAWVTREWVVVVRL